MVKKISAVILALMLCLSIVVMPVSAVELGDANIAFELKWDKEFYKAGDTAVLSVYMDAKDDLALYTGAFTIGFNSATIPAEQYSEVIANAVGNEFFESYFTAFSAGLSKSAATYVTRIQGKNTEEENATYDWYLKYTAGKNASGSHENALNNKDGFYFSDYDSSEPIVVLTFKVADGIADGTAIPAAITSGTTACTPAQTAWKYYTSPGTGTGTGNIAAATFDVSQAVATATVGAEACDHSADKITWEETTPATYTSEGEETGTCSCGKYTTTRPIAMKVLVSALKGQMRYNLEDDTKFDVRALAKIPAADFQAAFGDTVNAKAMIKEAGFVFASGENITTPDMDAVKALVKDGTEVTGYAKKTITYISDSISSGNYVFSCLVTGLDEDTVSSADQSLIAIGYIAWDADKDGVVDSYAFYPETQTIKFADLYANKK